MTEALFLRTTRIYKKKVKHLSPFKIFSKNYKMTESKCYQNNLTTSSRNETKRNEKFSSTGITPEECLELTLRFSSRESKQSLSYSFNLARANCLVYVFVSLAGSLAISNTL